MFSSVVILSHMNLWCLHRHFDGDLARSQSTSMKRAIDISITAETDMTAFDWIFVFQIQLHCETSLAN